MKILAIETSCDDTCAAVLEDDKVLSNIVSSQERFHKKFGGIVPSIARTKHNEMIGPVVEKAIKLAGISYEDLDFVAVTYGPGLAIALEVGIKKAQEIVKKYNKPLIAVNHLEGHILSPFLKNKNGKYYTNSDVKFPFLAVVVSGGHTQLVLVEGVGKYKLIGQTLDDAAGEAFDKVARLLKLGYPGGPLIGKIAEEGDKNKYDLPRCMENSKDFNFSFSGLKTGALVKLRKMFDEKQSKKLNDSNVKISFKQSSAYYDSKDLIFSRQEIADFAASFEFAVVDIIVKKTKAAVKKYGLKYVSIGGGVSANVSLRRYLRSELAKIGVKTVMPNTRFCTDNAGMIGIVAYEKAKRGEILKDPMNLEREPVLNFD